MEQLSEPRSAPKAKASGSEIRPGRRSLFKREVPASDTTEALSHVIAYLGSLQLDVESEEQHKRGALLQGVTLLQARRLRRTGTGRVEGFLRPYQLGQGGLALLLPALGDGAAPDPGRQTPLGDGSPRGLMNAEGDPVQPVVSAGSFVLSGGEENVRAAVAVGRRGPGWVAWSCLVVLLLGGAAFFLFAHVAGFVQARRIGAPTPSVAAAEGAGASDAALKTANAVIDAIGQGNLAKASALLAQAHSQGIILPGMRYQAALLALTLKNPDAADQWIEQSIAAHDSVPESLYLRASLEAGDRDYELAAAAFGEASRYTPFSPRNFFFRAECLRRIGKPSQAILQFEQALRCRPGPEDVDLIYFKMRLARLETGTDTAFQTQLAAKLAQEPVAGNTLLLGAANEINQGNQGAAIADVRKAAAVLPAAILRSRLRDFAFSSLPRGGDLSPASLPAAHGRGRMLPDPATQSLQQADPANW